MYDLKRWLILSEKVFSDIRQHHTWALECERDRWSSHTIGLFNRLST